MTPSERRELESAVEQDRDLHGGYFSLLSTLEDLNSAEKGTGDRLQSDIEELLLKRVLLRVRNWQEPCTTFEYHIKQAAIAVLETYGVSLWERST